MTTHTSSLQAVILGAGKPARGRLPSALFSIAGHGKVLDWQVKALRSSGADLVFVGGYRVPEIISRYPRLPVIVNPSWAQTGAVGSLLRADPQSDRSCVVTYADILYRDDLVKRLRDDPHDVAIAVDSRWLQRYENRSAVDRASAEVLQLKEGRLLAAYGSSDLGRPAVASAEFAGLAKLGPRALSLLREWGHNPETLRWDMPRLLNAFVAHGIAVAAIDCEGEWAELNAPQDVARFVLGTKAQTLQRLRPMVRNSTIGEQVAFSVRDWLESPSDCVRHIQREFPAAIVVVRSSALGEDGFDSSAAGRFESVLDVDASDARELSLAVDHVAASYGDANAAHQVLVQRMIQDARVSGVIMTRTLSYGAPYRVVNYDDSSGQSDTVTGGRAAALKTLYLHRESAELPSSAPPSMPAILSAVTEIEGLVGHDSLDIEFIVSSDERVHVVQIRPIAVNHQHWQGSDDLVQAAIDSARDDFARLQACGPFVLGKRAIFSVMTDWNPAEMIGLKPRRLAHSLYAELITDAVWAVQRGQYGYRRVASQPLMRSFMGHPYVDVRASFNSFIPADLDDGLAERLVEHYTDLLLAQPQLHDKAEFQIVLSCLAFDFSQRAQRLRASGFSVDEIDALRGSLATLTRSAFVRVDADCKQIGLLEHRHATLVSTELAPLRLALMLLDECRQFGTMPFAHLARGAFIAMTLLHSAVDTGLITEEERSDFLLSVTTVATDYRDDWLMVQAGALSMDTFLVRYGHLRPGTYEITMPSYGEAPSRYLGGAATPGSVPLALPERPAFFWADETKARFESALAEMGLDIGFADAESFMRRAIAGREHAKFVFTRSVSRALEELARFGATLGLSKDQLSNVSISDLRACDAGSLSMDPAGALTMRAEEGRMAHELALGIELPPLLVNPADFAGFFYPDAEPNFVGNSSVTASLLCVEAVEKIGDSLIGKIALIKQADPGYDWLFAHGIVGLVTAYGGANSHMAVRAAEFGLPAAIGVGEKRYEQLESAGLAMLDCRQRMLTILS